MLFWLCVTQEEVAGSWLQKIHKEEGRREENQRENSQLAACQDGSLQCARLLGLKTCLQIACTSRLPSVANQLEIYAPAVLLLLYIIITSRGLNQSKHDHLRLNFGWKLRKINGQIYLFGHMKKHYHLIQSIDALGFNCVLHQPIVLVNICDLFCCCRKQWVIEQQIIWYYETSDDGAANLRWADKVKVCSGWLLLSPSRDLLTWSKSTPTWGEDSCLKHKLS